MMRKPPVFASLYRPSRSVRRGLPLVLPAAVAIALGGCSLSMPLGSLVGARDSGPDKTASITPLPPAPAGTIVSAPLPPPSTDKPLPTPTVARAFAATTGDRGPAFSPADWVYARGALGLALTGSIGGPPVPWANPDTGTHGNFAPAAAAVTDGKGTCRAFVAQRVATGHDEHLSGRACRTPAGSWDIAEIRSQPPTL
jgi:surface antigen